MQKTIHVIIAIASFYIFFRYLTDYVSPFIVGFIISLMIEPFVRLLIKRGNFKRGLATFVALLIFTLAAVSVGAWGISSLSQEATEFLEAAPEYISSLERQLSAYPYYEDTAAGLLAAAKDWLSIQSVRAVGHVPGLLIGMILILVSAFFFSRDKEPIFALVAKWCPDWLRQYAKPVGRRLHHAWVGFLKSEFILLTAVAAISILALWILGNPYALMLGLVIALFDSLPIVGSGLILWPWAGYLALNGQYSQATFLMVLYGIITIVRNVIGPRILGEQIDMHPLAALMSMFMGIKAFGAAGILAGPALVIIAKAMMNTGVERNV
ncbi:MAG: AI-2E family transporter [Defluviitaleaceae bacterium]|nr:AI-2E family transporter [Defluviitaleaceae bacterium]